MKPDAKALAQRRVDVRTLMERRDFRRFAYWLLFRIAPIDGSSYAGEHTHQTAFNEGRRSVLIDIGRLLRGAHFNAFQQMEAEAQAAERADTVQGEPDSSGS